MAAETAYSVCPHDCPSACALEVDVVDSSTIGRVRGGTSNPIIDGIICAKVARYAERVHHPDRLTRPLKRVGRKGEGSFEPISWDEALDTVARAFADATERHGTETVWPYFYAGTMGLVQRDGIERLRHAMRCSGMGRTICSSVGKAGWIAGCGALRGTDLREIGESDLIVLWGVNAAATQVQTLHHATNARKARGARIIYIDPYETATAKAADVHLAPRPGTDGALACAVMHVLFAEGYADWDYMRRYTDAPERLQQHLSERTLAWAAAITGLSEDEIVGFARDYGSTERAFIRFGYGFTRSRNGAANLHAASCLPAVRGAWKHQGGGALMAAGDVFSIDRALIEGSDAADRSIRVLDMSRLGPVLTGDPGDLKGGPPVTAMIVQNTNPAVVAPESAKVRAGFLRDDLFLCVHEQFMTETARYADIVLPATTFLEHDDLYTSYGHSFVQVARPVIEPLGECRSNHDVVRALAERLGADHPGFRMTTRELIDATLAASGLPSGEDIHAAGGHDCAPSFKEAHFLSGFGWPDGRFRFAPDWDSLGTLRAAMPSLPDHAPLIEEADERHPFRLVTAPSYDFLNTSFTETAMSQKKQGRPTAFVHPGDCAEHGLSDGDPVRRGNARGSVVVHAKEHAGTRRGGVVVESVWPNAAFVEGIGINAFVGAEPVPPAGGAAFHDTAVWMQAERKAAE